LSVQVKKVEEIRSKAFRATVFEILGSISCSKDDLNKLKKILKKLDIFWQQKVVDLFISGVDSYNLVSLIKSIAENNLENNGKEYVGIINAAYFQQSGTTDCSKLFSKPPARDKIFKTIFSIPVLFLSFIKEFVKSPLVKDIELQDIERLPTDFINIYLQDRFSDVIYKVNINGTSFYFVIMLEHQSSVHQAMSFRMLEYMVMQWRGQTFKISESEYRSKGFKFWPIIPIILHDGKEDWTAPINFQDKVMFSDVFGKFTPSFEYEVVSTANYSIEKLAEIGSAVSFLLMMDKISAPEDFDSVQKLHKEFWDKIRESCKERDVFIVVKEALCAFIERIGIKDETKEQVLIDFNEGRYPKMFENCGSEIRATREAWEIKEKMWNSEKQTWNSKEKTWNSKEKMWNSKEKASVKLYIEC